MKNQARRAEGLARKLLEGPLPRRWAHVQGVAAQARALAPMLGDDADLLEAAAYLHDIGYAPGLDRSGLHALDGARYLRDVAQADPRLCGLVAHHSCAGMEAEERGLVDDLNREFSRPNAILEDALAYCDMTTTPTGDVIAVHDRLSEIVQRYGPGDIVTRFIRKAGPDLVNSVMRTQSRLCAAQ
jgi:putative nucleotidyltransferase with HDIG domain